MREHQGHAGPTIVSRTIRERCDALTFANVDRESIRHACARVPPLVVLARAAQPIPPMTDPAAVKLPPRPTHSYEKIMSGLPVLEPVS
jgi:hypothetical protein